MTFAPVSRCTQLCSFDQRGSRCKPATRQEQAVRRLVRQQGGLGPPVETANYSATWQYLHAVRAAGTTRVDAVLADLRGRRMKDVYLTDGWVRGDGILVHDMYVLRVKAPGDSKRPWDYYELVSTLAGESAWRPREESRCRLRTIVGRSAVEGGQSLRGTRDQPEAQP